VKLRALSIPDVMLVVPRVLQDARGAFFEAWNERAAGAAGLRATFVQDNAVTSLRGVLRGLHFQLPQPQGKLVRAITGVIFDVAVDIRRDSPTFGNWVGERLSGVNNHAMWIPPGFAHGYLTLSDMAHVYYKCTAFYAPEHEHSLAWDDPTVAIDWPLAETGAPMVAERDRRGTSLAATLQPLR